MSCSRDNLPQICDGFSISVIINSVLIDNSLRKEVGKLSIPVIADETGEALRFNERAIVTDVRGTFSVMRTLVMLTFSHIQTVRAEPDIAVLQAGFVHRWMAF